MLRNLLLLSINLICADHSIVPQVRQPLIRLRGLDDAHLRHLVHSLIYLLLVVHYRVRKSLTLLLPFCGVFSLFVLVLFGLEDGRGFKGDSRCAFLLRPLQTFQEVLAELIDQLLGIIGSFHALILHEAHEMLPLGDLVLVAIFIVRVQSLDTHCERPHINRSKRSVLIETSVRPTDEVRWQEPLPLELVQRTVVDYLACGLLQQVDLH